MTQPVVTCLWFNGNAEEAAKYYVQLFPNSHIGNIPRYPEGGPVEAGTAISVPFTLNGQSWLALNGNSDVQFNPSVSFVIRCENQEEIDHYWDHMIQDGGKAAMCGWLEDPFGVWWQIVPAMLGELMGGSDQAKSGKVLQALIKMQKIDMAALEAAYNA